MSTDVYNWRVYCVTEAAWIKTLEQTKPTVCPNDSGHSIRSVILLETDNILLMNSNSTNALVDSGFTLKYIDNGVTKYAGLIRDTTDETFKFFRDTQVLPIDLLDLGATGFAYAKVEMDNLICAGITMSRNLAITGTVDGRNIAADGTSLDNHIANMSNPHNVNINGIIPTTTKGDLIVDNGITAVRFPVGADNTYLVTDSTVSTGITWAIQKVARSLHMIAGRWFDSRRGIAYENALTSLAFTTAEILATPFHMAGAHSIDRIGINLLSSPGAGDVRIGIYSDMAGLPKNLVIDAGTLSTTSTGFKEITIDVALEARWYWLAIQTDDDQAKFETIKMNQVVADLGFANGTDSDITTYISGTSSGAFPSTFPTAIFNTGEPPRVVFRRT